MSSGLSESDWVSVQDFPGAGVGNGEVTCEADDSVAETSVAEKLQVADGEGGEIELSRSFI